MKDIRRDKIDEDTDCDYYWLRSENYDNWDNVAYVDCVMNDISVCDHGKNSLGIVPFFVI